ncbi:hypothetical protein SAMN05216338_106935 [Bradyrhizobium sp. Rc2d]|nr:hypothetical protein SAMN05216338_106935 [Bradyrhizobium sp. Rc2d]
MPRPVQFRWRGLIVARLRLPSCSTSRGRALFHEPQEVLALGTSIGSDFPYRCLRFRMDEPPLDIAGGAHLLAHNRTSQNPCESELPLDRRSRQLGNFPMGKLRRTNACARPALSSGRFFCALEVCRCPLSVHYHWPPQASACGLKRASILFEDYSYPGNYGPVDTPDIRLMTADLEPLRKMLPPTGRNGRCSLSFTPVQPQGSTRIC